MKKLIFSALSIALLTGAMTSCGKSSKGKLSNDWKIESFNNTATSTDEDGDKTVYTQVLAGTTVTATSTETVSGSTQPTETENYQMQNPTFKINKDGTWERTATIVKISTSNTNTTTTTTNEKSSGSWSFVNKNKTDEFKKNERVIFNTLASSSSNSIVTVSSVANVPTTTATSSGSNTYKAGEYVMLYTITESKGKALELSYEGNNTYSNTSGNTSYTESYVSSGKMNLVQ